MKFLILMLILFVLINPFQVLAGQSSDNSESDFWSTFKTAFDIVKGGWNIFDTVLSLFKEDYDAAKAEIIAAIEEETTKTWEREATSVINDYSLLLEKYSTDSANLFLSKSSSVVSQLQGIIRDESSWNAYLAAKPYNFVVPLRASVLKLEGYSDYQIKKLLNDAIEANKRFLGEYVFKDLPNIPQYDNRTTFSSCIIPPQGVEALPKECHELAPGEFKEFQEFIWKVNEDYRCQTIDHYYEQWFHIENLKEKGRCLKAKDSKLYLPICNSDDKSLLWQFNYSGRNEFELRHWSGDCLADFFFENCIKMRSHNYGNPEEIVLAFPTRWGYSPYLSGDDLQLHFLGPHDQTSNDLKWKVVQAFTGVADLTGSITGPHTAYSGQDITSEMVVNVSNVGTVATGGDLFSVDIVLSADEDLPLYQRSTYSPYFEEDVLLAYGHTTYSQPLQAGETVVCSVGAVIPINTPPGSYCLGMVVDPTCEISEMDETNNGICHWIDIVAPELPDLIGSISGPLTVYPGQIITSQLVTKVSNVGTVATEGDLFNVDIVLSSDEDLPLYHLATYSPYFEEDMLLKGGRTAITQPLQVGETVIPFAKVTIPIDTPPGSYCLGMVVDPACKIPETDDTNNGICHWIRVVSGTFELPDLIGSISGPLTVYPGQKITSQMVAKVSNVGTVATEGDLFSVDIVLSTDEDLPLYHLATYSPYFEEDMLLAGGSTAITQPLQAGETVTCSVGAAIPIDTPPGSYCLGMVVDPTCKIPETDDTNNGICHWIQVESAPELPDLIASITGPHTAYPGQNITSQMVAKVSNVGTVPTEGDLFSVNIVLSTDEILPLYHHATSSPYFEEDMLLAGGSTAITQPLQAGETVTCSVGAIIPIDTPLGSYCLGMVVDPTCKIPETDGTNNGICHWIQVEGAPELPDLIASITGPHTAYPGQNITSQMVAKVSNVGTVPTEGDLFSVNIVLSTDEVLPLYHHATSSPYFEEDMLLAGGSTVITQPLQAGETVTSSVGAVIPIDTPPGSYCLGMVVDPTCKIPETDNTNNGICHWIQVESAPELPDLIGSITGPHIVYPGQDITSELFVYVSNVGTKAMEGESFNINIMLSTDGIFPLTYSTYFVPYFEEDVILDGGWTFYTQPLQAGETVAISIGAVIPLDTPPGSYCLALVVDPIQSVSEVNEANNGICHWIEVATPSCAVAIDADMDGHYTPESCVTPADDCDDNNPEIWNCNTPVGEDVTIMNDTGKVTVTFPSVTGGGDTIINAEECEAPPEGLTIAPYHPICVEITTDASFEGEAQICISYVDEGLSMSQQLNLKMVRCGELGNCSDITCDVDINNNIVCGCTDHFSVFAVGIPTDRDCDLTHDLLDNCPDDYNIWQQDTDKDGIGDVCDNCPNDYNIWQQETDKDCIGDACDNCPDFYDPTNQCKGPQMSLSLPANWSMISLPVALENPTSSILFPEAIVIYGYQKGIGYIRIEANDTLQPGKGYWILLPEAKTYSFTGQIIEEYIMAADDGWFMIGGCTFNTKVTLNIGEIVIIYSYEQGTGYQRISDFSNIDPGKGYWILFQDTNEQSELRVNIQF